MNSTCAITDLTALGLGQYAAGIVSIGLAAIGLLTQIMPYLPVASATSSPFYAAVYGILAQITGTRGKAAPTPTNGLPAGGLVPAPPVAPATFATTKP